MQETNFGQLDLQLINMKSFFLIAVKRSSEPDQPRRLKKLCSLRVSRQRQARIKCVNAAERFGCNKERVCVHILIPG